MENNNIFLTAKAAIVGACAAYVAAFGYVGVLCAVGGLHGRRLDQRHGCSNRYRQLV